MLSWIITSRNVLYADGNGLSIYPTILNIYQEGKLEGIEMVYSGDHFDFLNKEYQRFYQLYKFYKKL
jgi:hypothetical protein